MIYLLFFVVLPAPILFKIVISAVLAGFGLSIVGTFVVHMKITTVGFCMSHAAFAGAALGLLLNAYGSQLDATYMALIFTVLIALLLGPLSNKTKLDSNIILGIVFSLMIALGFIFLSLLPTGVTGASSLTIIWGSLFGLSEIEALILSILNISLIILIVLFFKEFIAIMMNKKLALTAGINVKFFEFLILFATAVAVSFSLKIVGAFLVYAMIVNPTSTVHQFVYDTKKLFILSPIIGVFTILGGIYLSLYADFPVASSIIVFSSIVFAIAVIISPKRRKSKKKTKTKQSPVQYKNHKEFFEKFAETWDEITFHDPKKIKKILSVLDLKSGQKVVDVGSGTGVMIPYLFNCVKESGSIVALDFSENMIMISKRKYPIEKFPNLKFEVQDINNFSMNREYDAILCYSCFPHFKDKDRTISHLSKGLKKQGKLMIAHSDSRETINNIHINAKSKIIHKDSLPTIEKISSLMEKSGLKVIETLDSNEMFYILGVYV